MSGAFDRAPVVLHLISSLMVGGAERLLVSTMAAAKDRSAARFVVVIMNEAVDAGLRAELRASGHPVHHLARPEGRRDPRYLLTILRIIRAHNVEIIHTHNDGSLAWGMLAKLAMPRLKLVYTRHEQGGAAAAKGLRRFAYRRLVDRTLAISRSVAEETWSLAGGRVTLVENGVDLSRFEGARRRERSSGPVRLVQVGRFAPVKGQDILIDAVKTCVDAGLDVSCTLVGVPSDPAFHELLRERVAQHGLGEHVRFELGRTDIEAILPHHDIFVLPSRQEGFGLAIVEAMAAGLPVIVADTGGAKDIVSHAGNGLLFRAGDAADLAGRIAELAGAPQICRRLAEAGATTARRYDIRRTLESLGAVYRALMPAGGAPAELAVVSGSQGVETSARTEMPQAASRIA